MREKSVNEAKEGSQVLGELLGQKKCLEIHVTDTRNEIKQLKTALRVTRKRLRCINAEVELAKKGWAPLKLVYDSNIGVIE